MDYCGLCARGFGSDVLLSFALHKQGLSRITDAIDTGSKQKTLCARRHGARSIARRVHDTCICGKHDHLSGSAQASSQVGRKK